MNKKAIIKDIFIIMIIILIFGFGWFARGEIESKEIVNDCNKYWNDYINDEYPTKSLNNSFVFQNLNIGDPID